MASIQQLRQKILDRKYILTSHADDEMMADNLEREDIEHAILAGRIEKRLTADVRGPRYRIAGTSRDGREVRVLCRLIESGDLLVITVYVPEEHS